MIEALHAPARRVTRLATLLVASAVSTALLAAGSTAQSAGLVPSLETAAAALRKGDAAGAASQYEVLAQQSESLEAELGLVRSLFQAGEFRKALSYANLTAGEHPESADAQALLAFLNDRTGRTELALTALKKLESARPAEWRPVAVHAEILRDRLAPEQAEALIEAWSARNPGARGDSFASWLGSSFQPLTLTGPLTSPPTGHRVMSAGNGVILDEGKTVLTYAAVVPRNAATVILRNGLGQVRRAAVQASTRRGDVVRLRLSEPFPASASVPLTQVSGPEGVRFCFMLGFSTPRDPAAAYPAIAPGLVVNADARVGGLMQITSALGTGHNGAPVFDARGKLIGLALGAGDQWIAGTDVRKALGNGAFAMRVDDLLTAAPRPPRGAVTPPAGKQPPMPAVEELFERLAPTVVQIMTLD